MRHLSKLFFLFLACFVFSGCEPNQTVRNIWKDTKSYYREYLNTPAQLHMENTGSYDDYVLRAGASMAVIEEQLDQLIRVMDDSDRGPDNAWALDLLKRYPWLSGLAILDGEGREMARVPEFSLKEFDGLPLLEEDPKQRRSSLRAYVQKSPLGPEVYLGKPVYMGDELRAVVIAHFDMRALLAHHKEAAQLVIATPEVMLWPGIYDIDQTPLANLDWESMVKSDVSGTVSNNTGKFYWISSYFANLRLIYALASEGEFALRPEQLDMLNYADAFAVPNISISPPETPGPASTMGEFLEE